MLKWYRICPVTIAKKVIMANSEFNVNTYIAIETRLPTWNCHASCYNKKAVPLTKRFQTLHKETTVR